MLLSATFIFLVNSPLFPLGYSVTFLSINSLHVKAIAITTLLTCYENESQLSHFISLVQFSTGIPIVYTSIWISQLNLSLEAILILLTGFIIGSTDRNHVFWQVCYFLMEERPSYPCQIRSDVPFLYNICIHLTRYCCLPSPPQSQNTKW